jgi:hypothetical protein
MHLARYARPPVRPRSISLLALATGAVAIGAFAIGALAIGRLAIRNARIKTLEIDELTVRKLKVVEPSLPVMPPKPTPGPADKERFQQAQRGTEH